MKIKISRRCQGCSVEFIIDSENNELEKDKETGKITLACPICGTENLIYVPKISYE